LSDTARNARELQSIQILRAVAALGVLVLHTLQELSEHTAAPRFLADILIGAAGVDLFFVISGFVMVYASEALFAQRGAPRYFLLRRLARIVPLYWATTLFFLLYMLAAHRTFPPGFDSWSRVLPSFVFWPYPRIDGSMGPVHALGWTLNYEIFFYVVFALALWLPRRAAVFSVVALFCVIVFGTWTTPLPQPLNFWRSPIILEFCYGMLIAYAYREGVRIPRAATWALFALALAGYAISMEVGFDQLWRFVQWGLPGAALVAAFALARQAQGSGSVARAFAFLGDASYSIYLVHPIAFPFVRRGILPFLPVENAFGQILYAALLIAASIALSVASYLYFERPITRVLQRRIDRWRPARAKESGAEPALKTVAP
jgi:peptidoglycan/LPS O-acetylase OafA/YrhL